MFLKKLFYDILNDISKLDDDVMMSVICQGRLINKCKSVYKHGLFRPVSNMSNIYKVVRTTL